MGRVAEGCACPANAALRMWPDPNQPAQATAVAVAVERKNGRVDLELNANFYPFDGPIPGTVPNLLYRAVQSTGSIPAGQPADVLEPHLQTITVYKYSGEGRRPAGTAAIVAGNFGPENDVQNACDHLLIWLASHDPNRSQALMLPSYPAT